MPLHHQSLAAPGDRSYYERKLIRKKLSFSLNIGPLSTGLTGPFPRKRTSHTTLNLPTLTRFDGQRKAPVNQLQVNHPGGDLPNPPPKMPYLPTLNAFLHSASLLLTAYPTARITTKYSLPRGPKEPPAPAATEADSSGVQREKKEPSATLTVKVFHPATGICLKYATDKSQEVGRLITSLGRLARGEAIEAPTAATGAGEDAADKMDVDSGPAVAVKQEDAVAAGKPVGQQQQGQAQGQSGGGGGGKKKKKGKR